MSYFILKRGLVKPILDLTERIVMPIKYKLDLGYHII